MRCVVIGAGAAGCFCALHVARLCKGRAEVLALEKRKTALSKLALTGGGRCNFSHDFSEVERLEAVYPRGHRLMRRLLHNFSDRDAVDWFASEGVPATLEEDGRWFPRSQDAMDVVRCLEKALSRAGVAVRTGCAVRQMDKAEDGKGYLLHTAEGTLEADCVVVATGGLCTTQSLPATGLGWEVIPPVPSLFTLALDDEALCALQGIAVPAAKVRLAGTPFEASGALLITDWGFSGPAILTLSSRAARHLAETGYKGTLCISWMDASEDALRVRISRLAGQLASKKLSSTPPEGLPRRLWPHLVRRAGLPADFRWGQVEGRGLGRLASTLAADTYSIAGKCPFKGEFVTCGGIALGQLDPNTLEHRQYKGLYFAGEALDIDAVTGGFNLQAAWTTGYTVAHAIAHLNSHSY